LGLSEQDAPDDIPVREMEEEIGVDSSFVVTLKEEKEAARTGVETS
jgi:hypothetical protein